MKPRPLTLDEKERVIAVKKNYFSADGYFYAII